MDDSDDFRVERRLEAGVAVVAPHGDVDLRTMDAVRAELAAAQGEARRVVLDLRGVTFMDSSALSIVLAAERRLTASGGELRLAHVSADVRRVLRICGLSALVLPAPLMALRHGACRTADVVG